MPGSHGESPSQALSDFLRSRRQGLSPQTITFYNAYLTRASSVVGIGVTGQDIAQFLSSRQCSNGGKHAYHRALRAFYNWLYSPWSGYNLSPQNNPILAVDSPKVERPILPSLTEEQILHLIDSCETIRDQAIVSVFADTGLRLNELAGLSVPQIDFSENEIAVWVKGGKEGLAVFGEDTKKLLLKWLDGRQQGKLWDMNSAGIVSVLRRLEKRTGLHCNPHSFRRSFACSLRRNGIGVLDIKELGRWETLQMVELYTKSVNFRDSKKNYRPVVRRNSEG